LSQLWIVDTVVPGSEVLLALLMPSAASSVHLPLELLLIFGCAKLLANICERFKQPGIVGEIFAGILLGPSVLAWVRPGEITAALAEMGVLFLLFRVGLEVRTSELLRVGRIAALVASLGVAVPFLLGWGFMVAIGVSRIEAVFVGAALVATSVGITAQVLAAKGLLDQRASKVILAAAVIDDVLGLLVLAVVSGMAGGKLNISALITTGIMATAFTVLIAVYGSRMLQRVVPRVEKALSVQEGQFDLALVVLFGLSVLAAFVGVAAIVGAFLAGMALSESVTGRVKDLAHGITELLIPFFLADIGLHLDISVFASRYTLLMVLGVSGLAIISKFVACSLGATALGRGDMMRIGVGMIPRGEVGMVVAQIGLAMGVVERSIYGVVVAMAIITTLVAPPLLNYAYRGCRPSAREEEFSLA
jgi:Kef-type K+ transport system membrane component KefB